MTGAHELLALLRRCIPFIVREDDTALRILAQPDNHIIRRRAEDGALIAAAVVHGCNIYMLCVDPAHRRRGIGGALLRECEEYIRAHGGDRVTIGADSEYLTPGVPVRTPPYAQALMPAQLYGDVTDDAWAMLLRRGYVHSWGDCNCFDMRVDAGDVPAFDGSIGDELNGLRYRWAEPGDLPAVTVCTDAAQQSFTRYYADPALYSGAGRRRALIAERDGRVCGVLMVCRETEGPDRGSVGCTAVHPDWQGQGIAKRLVLLGTRHLCMSGMRECFLGYTYSGLDVLYGRAGYRICVYYAMARRQL